MLSQIYRTGTIIQIHRYTISQVYRVLAYEQHLKNRRKKLYDTVTVSFSSSVAAVKFIAVLPLRHYRYVPCTVYFIRRY